MTKEKLFEGILKLPPIKVGTIAKADQKIESSKGRVHYKMTREMVPTTGGGISFFLLAASGPEDKRLLFIDKITAKLGPPVMVEELAFIPGTHFVIWKTEEVEERLKRNPLRGA